MSQFYICKLPKVRTGDLPQAACLKVVNDKGSLAFDDSCGCLPNLGRVSMAIFEKPESSVVVEPEVFYVSAEDFLETLAYSVKKET
jgi:hypothetical protein